MTSLSSIGSLSTREALPEYDGLLVALGFESRSTFACSQVAPKAVKKTACAFTERHTSQFDANLKWFRQATFAIEDVPESQIEEWTHGWFTSVIHNANHPECVHVCVDISSMSRRRLASVLAAALRLDGKVKLTVDFLYSIAKWCPPSEEPEPIISAGAVLPFFSGWSSNLELPIVAFFGLGYEPDKAVGAYEYLEASEVWAFIPISNEVKYKRDVDRANHSLLLRVPEHQRIVYDVDQPVSCFGRLESIVYGTIGRARPVLLPFGPKIFALCSMLVASLHRDVPIWRISPEQHGPAVDREASGQIVGLRAEFKSIAPK